MFYIAESLKPTSNILTISCYTNSLVPNTNSRHAAFCGIIGGMTANSGSGVGRYNLLKIARHHTANVDEGTLDDEVLVFPRHKFKGCTESGAAQLKLLLTRLSRKLISNRKDRRDNTAPC